MHAAAKGADDERVVAVVRRVHSHCLTLWWIKNQIEQTSSNETRRETCILRRLLHPAPAAKTHTCRVMWLGLCSMHACRYVSHTVADIADIASRVHRIRGSRRRLENPVPVLCFALRPTSGRFCLKIRRPLYNPAERRAHPKKRTRTRTHQPTKKKQHRIH